MGFGIRELRMMVSYRFMYKKVFCLEKRGDTYLHIHTNKQILLQTGFVCYLSDSENITLMQTK